MAILDIILPAETVFSRPCARHIEASEAARNALAGLCGAVACDSFVADLTVEPSGPTRAALDLSFEARLVQTCVVSLEPVETVAQDHYTATIILGTPRPEKPADAHLIDVDEEEKLYVEKEGMLDVGGLLEELFVLSVDPYPRKQGAQLEQGPYQGVTIVSGESQENGGTGAAGTRKPFAGLDALLKQKQEKS